MTAIALIALLVISVGLQQIKNGEERPEEDQDSQQANSVTDE